MRGRSRQAVFAAIAAGAVAIGIPAAVAGGHDNHGSGEGDHRRHEMKHALLISVDGLHQSDLDWYVANHPRSELAKLATGGDVVYDSPDDLDSTRLDAGQGLQGLPGNILQMTGKPQTLLRPSTFPVDPATCKPIYPHSYLKVNTIFEVAQGAGLPTAWSEKHPVYESFNGPSGTGIDDMFARD
jgi:hypothetical protein